MNLRPTTTHKLDIELYKKAIPVDEWLEGLFTMQDEIINQQRKAEEKILIEVLEQRLGRTATTDDFKLCAKVNTGCFPVYEGYIFTYMGEELGRMRYKFSYLDKPDTYQTRIGVHFEAKKI